MAEAEVLIKPARIAIALFVLVCFLSPLQTITAQDAQPPEPPATETPPAESTDQTQETESGSERLNPETDTPEEGMVIGDGDDMSIVDNFVQIHGNALIKFEDVILRADHVWADFDENLMRASGNVHLIVGDEETYSDELIFNLENKKGIARNGFTYSDPWYFGGVKSLKLRTTAPTSEEQH